MSMQTASLEVLEKANLPSAQAKAIVQAIEIEIAGAQTTLATKQDIHGVELKIEGLRGEIHASARDTVWRMLVAIGTQTGILLGLAYFALAHLKP